MPSPLLFKTTLELKARVEVSKRKRTMSIEKKEILIGDKMINYVQNTKEQARGIFK